MIEVKNLVKHFGNVTAVNDISLQVQKGEVLGFLGPNGAGKSTTMKIITCFLSPNEGDVNVCGHSIHDEPIKVREKIGYLPESAPSYSDMSVLGFLKFVSQIRGLAGASAKEKLDKVIGICQLEGVLHKKIETLSKGFKQRTCFAQALLHDPEVLVLDEPTDGLDPNQKHEMRQIIKELGKEKTIILSTHILEEVDAVCSRAIIITNGKVVANGTPSELRQKSKYYGAVNLILKNPEIEKVKSTLEDLQLTKLVEVNDMEENSELKSFIILPNENAPELTTAVNESAKNFGWNVSQIFTEQGRLDEVFRTLTAVKN